MYGQYGSGFDRAVLCKAVDNRPRDSGGNKGTSDPDDKEPVAAGSDLHRSDNEIDC